MDGVTQGITDALSEKVAEIGEFFTSLGDSLTSFFETLFVPDTDTFAVLYDELCEKIPFLDMYRKSEKQVQVVKDIFTNLGEVIPVIEFDFSKTPLKKYGVNDVSISMEWFEPYRQNVHDIMSAIMLVVFVYNQYFRLANIINGVGTGMDVTTELRDTLK